MKSRIWIVGTVTVFFLGWLNCASAKSAADKIYDPVFPQLIEVIPGKLKLKVFLHDIQYGSETIPCWTYVTQGLSSLKQREIIFTLQRDTGQKPEDYPREVAELFAEIFQSAEHGDPVDVGEFSLLGEAGFLGNKDIKGIAYVEPERFPGVETGGAPLLAAILLKNDEAAIARDFGLTRVLALLGRKYHYYPCPPWSDLKRQPDISLDAMGDSILKKVAKAKARATFYEEHNRVSLRMFLKGPPGSPLPLHNLAELPADRLVVLFTQIDERANACVVWPTEGGKHVAISPPDSDGTRRTGNFITFVPEQNANEIKWAEDGLAIFLTNSDWKKIRDAILSGSDLLIPPSGKDGASFSLEWVQREYTSPVTGEVFPFAATGATQQDIPPGIKYKPAPDSVNAAAKLKLERALANGAAFPEELLGENGILCGPTLWKFLKPSADKTLLQALKLLDNIPLSDGVIVVEGRGMRNEQEKRSFWKALMAKYPSLQTAKVRKATSREISYFWATTAFDIDEPFFAIDAGSQTFVMHMGRETDIYTFDLVGNLRDLRGIAPKGVAAAMPESEEPTSSRCLTGSNGERIVNQEEIEGKLIHKVQPAYPDEARAAGIQGTVVMCALIGEDGRIKSLTPISGPQQLIPAAMEAVKKWRYSPFQLNNKTVEVITDIRVNFAFAP